MFVNCIKIKIGIMGVTFKENCNDLRGSKVIDIINLDLPIIKCGDYALILVDTEPKLMISKGMYL